MVRDTAVASFCAGCTFLSPHSPFFFSARDMLQLAGAQTVFRCFVVCSGACIHGGGDGYSNAGASTSICRGVA